MAPTSKRSIDAAIVAHLAQLKVSLDSLMTSDVRTKVVILAFPIEFNKCLLELMGVPQVFDFDLHHMAQVCELYFLPHFLILSVLHCLILTFSFVFLQSIFTFAWAMEWIIEKLP